jgi:hypothetical protein
MDFIDACQNKSYAIWFRNKKKKMCAKKEKPRSRDWFSDIHEGYLKKKAYGI